MANFMDFKGCPIYRLKCDIALATNLRRECREMLLDKFQTSLRKILRGVDPF
jgi:hypothetical protein